ncbi:ArgS-related anticodon-binding protein NrtL [Streptomyces kebangsaanensis]|uniref:ArgS-related anticodon-binding protein NrtL n=1 Tax=Streptomyces kebangsaanensis TaxID=864058 RepID=UPI00093938F1|nr:DALR anticodon-binding domain-containing protein [Streptomyces kebangsaanensis]
MTPVELSRTVLCAVRRAVDVGELRVTVPERAVVARPRPGGCGDYATNIALQLARPAGQPAPRVAQVLKAHLLGLDGIDDVSVTGPGFLNISLRDADADVAFVRLVDGILRAGVEYGFVPEGGGASGGSDGSVGAVVQLRCFLEVRAVVVADALRRLLRSQGASVGIRCESPVPAAWEQVLGVRVDSSGGASSDGVEIRPVPAPADPLPLGRDAARWALLLPAAHDHPRITEDHLVQRESNPLFRVRYAHARTRALSRNAADLGFSAEPGITEVPRDLVTLLVDHPRVLARAAAHRAPDSLARHLVSVADAVLPFLPSVLPRGEEKPLAAHRARLALAEAAGAVLAGGLSLLGIDAPDHL